MEKKHICKFCGKEFPTPAKLGGHVSKCPERPDINEIQSKCTFSRKKNYNIIPRTLKCVVCGKEYQVVCSDHIFETGKYKKTCSVKCSHDLTNMNTDLNSKNIKISKKLNKFEGTIEYTKFKEEKKYTEKLIKKNKEQNRVRDLSSYKFRHIEVGQCWFCGKYNCQDDFCKKVNFNHIMCLIKYFGYDSMKLCSSEAIEEYNRIKNLLSFLHNELHMTMEMIRDYLDIKRNSSSCSFLYSVFNKMEIPHRNLSQAGHIAMLEGRSVGFQEKNTGLLFHTEYHKSWDGNTYYLRSGYESKYANLLDENKISYQVEKLRIEYFDTQEKKYRVAIPDFYLPETNEIIEVKSELTLDIQNMKDKFESYKKLGYKPKLLYENQFEDLYSMKQSKLYEKFQQLYH